MYKKIDIKIILGIAIIIMVFDIYYIHSIILDTDEKIAKYERERRQQIKELCKCDN